MNEDERQHLVDVRELCCSVCDAPPPSYAHHPRFAAGLSQKASDYLAIALCYADHQGPDGIHGTRSRWKIYKMDEPKALAVTIEGLRRRGKL